MSLTTLLFTISTRIMPRDRENWTSAMFAELSAIPERERLSFALGCLQTSLHERFSIRILMRPLFQLLAQRPRVTAVLGLLMTLPLPLLVTIAYFQLEPAYTPLRSWFTEPDGVRQTLHSFIALLVAVTLLPLASAMTLSPVLRGSNAFGLRVSNLCVGVTALILFCSILGFVAIDQLPCWMGVPNCD